MSTSDSGLFYEDAQFRCTPEGGGDVSPQEERSQPHGNQAVLNLK